AACVFEPLCRRQRLIEQVQQETDAQEQQDPGDAMCDRCDGGQRETEFRQREIDRTIRLHTFKPMLGLTRVEMLLVVLSGSIEVRSRTANPVTRERIIVDALPR